jgi:general secretion pathway protein I
MPRFHSPFPIPHSPHAQRANGFTLIEVLAAIALLAIAFAVGLGALGKAAQNAGRSAALATAVERAQSLLAEQGLTAPLRNETLSGHFDDGMRWTLKVHALPKPAPAQGDAEGVALQQQGALLAQATAIDLYQLDVAVQYGADRTLRLSTQRAQAAPPDGNRE